MYAESLRQMSPSLQPEVDDLFLLEEHQIEGLCQRAPTRELAAVLHADPRLRRFLVVRHPPIADYLDRVLNAHGPARARDLEASAGVHNVYVSDGFLHAIPCPPESPTSWSRARPSVGA